MQKTAILLASTIISGLALFVSVLETNDEKVFAQISSSNFTRDLKNYIDGNITWKPYTNEKYGISFEIPAIWNVTEKTDRFSKDPDLFASLILYPSFKFIDHKKTLDDVLKYSTLEDIATEIQTTFTNKPGDRLIEDVNTNKYSLDENPTASFLYTSPGVFSSSSDVAQQIFLVNHDDKIYTFGYSNTVENFDSKQSQDIMNHIINSLKFTDSSSSDDKASNSDNSNKDKKKNND